MKTKILIIFLTIDVLCYSQTPANDPIWQLEWVDEFDYFDSNRWIKADYCDHGGEPQLYLAQNISINNGNLVITLKKENSNCPTSPPMPTSWICGSCNQGTHAYTSGWIETKNTSSVQYGYIEARVKLPYGYGYWPAFWTWMASSSTYQEMDIFEMIPGTNEYCVLPGASNFLHDYNIMTSNMHNTGVPNPNYFCTGNYKITQLYDYRDWHNYAIEWSPSKITWYVDNSPIRTEVNDNKFDPTNIILNFALNNHEFPQNYNFGYPYGSLPAEMKVDFVKYYKLRRECSISISTCSYSFVNHTNTLKNNILLGGNGCYNVVPNDKVYYFRSANGILINGDFEVPFGSQIVLNGDACY